MRGIITRTTSEYSKVDEFLKSSSNKQQAKTHSTMSLRHSLGRTGLYGRCRPQFVHFLPSPAASQTAAAFESQPWRRNKHVVQSTAFSTMSTVYEKENTTDDLDSVANSLATESEAAQATITDNASAPSPLPSRPSANQAALPWYLQVDSPIPEQERVLSERQRLPELPPHSPPLLQPILEHVSVDLGLDDLSLLDLRALDPPPALGANLLMLIGTARSEKHLHVSADRLCRWLRSEHGISPFADGLLGRNELKLKVRRKAKRSRLLSAVGAKETASTDIDDGIRTGWVCVNVGKVEGGVLPHDRDLAATKIENFVGFGSHSTACNIVVQMMTDEKRGQIDLETLWKGILRRSKKSQAEQKGELEDAEKRLQQGHVIESASAASVDLALAPSAAVDLAPAPSPRPSVAERKPKSYPTEETEVYRPAHLKPPVKQVSRLRVQRAFHTSTLWQWPTTSKLDDKGAHLPGHIATSDNNSDPFPSISNPHAPLTLRHLLDQLKAMRPERAVEALGKGARDTETTPFLSAFYRAMPGFPDPVHWQMHIELRCHAVHLRHPHYSPKSIVSELEAMRLACLLPTEQTYMLVLETLLTPLLDTNVARHDRPLYKKTVSLALDLLDQMHEFGYNPVSDDILRLLYRTTSLPPLPSYPTTESADIPPEAEGTSNQFTRPLTFAELLSALSASALATAAENSSWRTVLSIWRSYPQRSESRSSLLYTTLFRSAAKTNDQRVAVNSLRSCVPDMSREEPVVELEGEVASAVKECLHVAEPKAQDMGERGGRGEWAILWRRLMRRFGSQ
ncbi:hypothetical protein BDV97DRAFT_356532 [Delphinella strobiligena]|nr:hypothetical protein BDV97DRAFT_356532 [Delphinella strobiligena]